MSLSDRCAIVGIGTTPYTRGTDRTTLELHLEASLLALADAGIEPEEVDGVLPSAVAGRHAEEFVMNLGLRGLRYSTTVHMGGASLIASIQNACAAITSGLASCVLIPAGRRGYSGERVSTGQSVPEGVMDSTTEFERPYGNLVAVQWFAQVAMRHMHEYGTTSEQLGLVAVNSRANANLNPRALMHGRPMTLADHQASRMISSPFRLLDCSLESDGAGALVVTSVERARDLDVEPVRIGGVAEAHSYPSTSLSQKPDMAQVATLTEASERAFAMAGITPADLDCLQVHEGFTWYVLAALEAIGVVGRGEGGPFVEAGHIAARGPVAGEHRRRLALGGPRLGHQPRDRSRAPAAGHGRARAAGRRAASTSAW